MPDFVKIGQFVAKILLFFVFFSRWPPSANRHHGFVLGIYGPPTKSTWWSLSLQNFLMIDALVSNNMNVLIFGAFGQQASVRLNGIVSDYVEVMRGVRHFVTRPIFIVHGNDNASYKRYGWVSGWRSEYQQPEICR